jgi:hypothetical protein
MGFLNSIVRREKPHTVTEAEKTAAERDADIVRRFRNVFSSEDGRIVLSLILIDLKIFEPAETPADAALAEYGKKFIFSYLGARDPVELTEAILSVTPRRTRIKE